MKTYSAKQNEIVSDWVLIDAKNQTLGRLASTIATILTGKNKPSYTPNVISGDKVVVINSAKIKVTGQKLTDKMYYRHTGYPGGIREISLREQLVKNPNKVIEDAVSGMLPKNKLQAKMLKNLKVYANDEQPHSSQKLTTITMEKTK